MPTVARFSNFDYMVYASLQHSLDYLTPGAVDFELNSAPRQIVSIKGSQLLAAHGDHLRGGDKQMAIPLLAIGREVAMTTQRQALTQEAPIDYFVVGDKHKSASLPLPRGAYLMNGSFVGADEFSSFNFPPSEPAQLLFWLHPIAKKTWQYEVKLQFAPRLEQIPYDLPPRLHDLLEQYR